MVQNMLAVSAASFGVAMALSPLLQIRQMLRRRSSADVSIGYFTILTVGVALWIAYGFALGNAALIVPNVVGVLTNLGAIVVAVSLRRRHRDDQVVHLGCPTAHEAAQSAQVRRHPLN